MWLTIEELSDRLKLSKEIISKLAKRKMIPSTKFGDEWRFNREIINTWLENECLGFDEKAQVRLKIEEIK